MAGKKRWQAPKKEKLVKVESKGPKVKKFLPKPLTTKRQGRQGVLPL